MLHSIGEHAHRGKVVDVVVFYVIDQCMTFSPKLVEGVHKTTKHCNILADCQGLVFPLRNQRAAYKGQLIAIPSSTSTATRRRGRRDLLCESARSPVVHSRDCADPDVTTV